MRVRRRDREIDREREREREHGVTNLWVVALTVTPIQPLDDETEVSVVVKKRSQKLHQTSQAHLDANWLHTVWLLTFFYTYPQLLYMHGSSDPHLSIT